MVNFFKLTDYRLCCQYWLIITRIFLSPSDVIRCYLFQSWKSNEPNVVLNFGNLRSLPNQYESLLWGQK